MLVDSHAHLNFPDFDQDREDVFGRCRDLQMSVINVGTNAQTSSEVVALAHKEPSFFASVGIHPTEVSELMPQGGALISEFERIEQLAKESKVVAIGEIGLDYYRLTRDIEAQKQIQKEYFIKQVDLALSHGLPLIIHGRGAPSNPYQVYEDILQCLSAYPNTRGVAHCFGGDLSLAQKYIERGFLIGITGIITFKNNTDIVRKVAQTIPLEKLLIETDCPYLAPEPYRGKRNESSYVKYVADKIAELKNVAPLDVIVQTTDNARQLFKF